MGGHEDVFSGLNYRPPIDSRVSQYHQSYYVRSHMSRSRLCTLSQPGAARVLTYRGSDSFRLLSYFLDKEEFHPLQAIVVKLY